MEKYRFQLAINADIALVTPSPELATEIFNVISANREHIGAFLPWVQDMVNVAVEENFIRKMMLASAQGTAQLFFIAYQGKLIGSVDLHNVVLGTRKGEIGYWLSQAYTKKGIMTTVVNFLINYAFEVLNFNKVTLQADTRNIASNNVAQRCGFQLVGTAHKDYLLYGELRDMNLYEKLRSDKSGIK